MLTAI
jgi:Cu2+-exporting ATPase